MKITIETKKCKELYKSEMDLMNKWRRRDFGPQESKNYKKDYPLDTNFFFVRDEKEIAAFGALQPIAINYLGKNYKILGICNIISLQKGKGYGKKLIAAMIHSLKKAGKTGLGFTTKTDFFKKAGLNTKKDFIRRFIYRNPITKEEIIDREGDGIYYEGKDGFIKKVLSNKSIVYIGIPHW